MKKKTKECVALDPGHIGKCATLKCYANAEYKLLTKKDEITAYFKLLCGECATKEQSRKDSK